MTLLFSDFCAAKHDVEHYLCALSTKSDGRVNAILYAKRLTPLLGFSTGRMARSKSHIVAFLHIFSPGSTQTFFPVRTLFCATTAREWTGLAVLIAHGYFAQQISWSGT